MSDYNDGSRFGGDVISPYDDIGLSFEQVQLGNRPMLLSRNEIPRTPAALPAQMDEISQKPLTRRIEGFTSIPMSHEDHQMLLTFLLIVVIIMQVRIMWGGDKRNYDGGHGPVYYYHMAPIPITVAPHQ